MLVPRQFLPQKCLEKLYLFKYPCLLHKFETNGLILGVGAKLLLTKKVFEFFCNLMEHGKAMAIQKSNGNTNAKDKDTGKLG